MDEYETAFFVPSVTPVWTVSNYQVTKNENGTITEYPIDNFPAGLGLQNIHIVNSLVTQEGYAWVVYQIVPFDFQNKYVTVFNGEEWIGGHSFYLQDIVKSFAKGNQAWFFTQDQVPINVTTSSTAYHYSGSQRTIMQYPVYCLSGGNNSELEIIDFIEDGDDYWILYNLSRASASGSSSCKSNILAKMNGNVFTEIAAKDIRDNGLISKIQMDLEGNLWMFRDNGISTFKPLSPTLETFSKPAFCNSGRALACITSGGLPPFDYLWNDGTTNPLKAPINPGSYSVTVTDANANMQANDLAIGGDGAFIEIQAAITPISCSSEADGDIEALVSGGTPPYQYVWSNGATTPMIEALAAEIYELTVTDAGGCDVIENYEITEPADIAITFDEEHTCFESQNGAINSLILFGNPPYQYLWSTGETTAAIENLASGIYSLTVTDALGCTENSPTIVLEFSELMLNLNAVNSQVGQSNGSITTNLNNGNPPYTYLWNTGETTQNLTDIPGGNYSVTVTDSNGCTAEQSKFILDVATGYEDPIFSKTSGNFIENAVAFQYKQKTILEERDTEISIYPNPFAEAFFIDLKNEKLVLSNLEVYTIFGQKMELQITENLLKNQVKIATTGWSSGAYFVHFSINDTYYKHKLIKY